MQEKSKGVVMFATNTADTDYVLIADRTAKLVEHHLGLPVTVISKNPGASTNQRFSVDLSKFVEWNNKGRYSVFDDSPYDTTLLLDADYVMLDNRMLDLFDLVDDYKIMRNNVCLPDEIYGDSLGEYSFSASWATAIIFNKTEKSRLLFDLVSRVQSNYAYYRSLYNISATNYRNDYAFTIADRMLSGYTEDIRTQIPWTMTTLQGSIHSMEFKGSQLVIRYENNALILPRQDVHVLGKQYLQSDNFGNFVEAVIA